MTGKPLLIAAAVCLLMFAGAVPVAGDVPEITEYDRDVRWVTVQGKAIATWYGGRYIGRKHAAAWHRQVPPGWPDVVDYRHLGVAAPPQFPFGTRVRITRLGSCWGGMPSEDGPVVEAVVLDRLGRPWHELWDLWPKTAAQLDFGPLVSRADGGCIWIRVEVLTQ